MMNNMKDLLKYTFSSAACLLCLAVLFFGFDFDFFASLVLTVFLGAFLYYWSSKKGRRPSPRPNTRKTSVPLRRVSPEKEAFYQSRGLSKDEMNMFRKTMHSAREKIYAVEKNINSRSKLKAIATRQNILAVMKDFFKQIAEQPERLPEVNQFLYTLLPNLKELTDHYIQIDNHVAKTKDTYDALNKCAGTIDELCDGIRTEYVSFMSNDLEDMDMEIELANHVLKRDNEDTPVSEPSEKEL